MALKDLKAYRVGVVGHEVTLSRQRDAIKVQDLTASQGSHLIDSEGGHKRAMGFNSLGVSLLKELSQREQVQQKQDADDMQGADLQAQRRAAKLATSRLNIDPTKELRLVSVEYQPRLLERVAKLEALGITTRQQKRQPLAEIEYINEEPKETAVEAQAKHAEDDRGERSVEVQGCVWPPTWISCPMVPLRRLR